MRVENPKSLQVMGPDGNPIVPNPARFSCSELGMNLWYMGGKKKIQQDQLFGARPLLEQLLPVTKRLREEFKFCGLLHQGIVNPRRIGNTKVWSEHSFGIAIDIWGFEHQDGRVIRVLDHKIPAIEKDLLQVRKLLLEYFHSVIYWTGNRSEAANRAHQDHFHVGL